jgi:hypothetical protein
MSFLNAFLAGAGFSAGSIFALALLVGLAVALARR